MELISGIPREEWIWLNCGWEEAIWLNNGRLLKPEAEICGNLWIIMDLVIFDTPYCIQNFTFYSKIPVESLDRLDTSQYLKAEYSVTKIFQINLTEKRSTPQKRTLSVCYSHFHIWFYAQNISNYHVSVLETVRLSKRLQFMIVLYSCYLQFDGPLFPILKTKLSESFQPQARTNQNHSDCPGYQDPSLLGCFPTNQSYWIITVYWFSEQLPCCLLVFSLLKNKDFFFKKTESLDYSTTLLRDKTSSRAPILFPAATLEAQDHILRKIQFNHEVLLMTSIISFTQFSFKGKKNGHTSPLHETRYFGINKIKKSPNNFGRLKCDLFTFLFKLFIIYNLIFCPVHQKWLESLTQLQLEWRDNHSKPRLSFSHDWIFSELILTNLQPLNWINALHDGMKIWGLASKQKKKKDNLNVNKRFQEPQQSRIAEPSRNGEVANSFIMNQTMILRIIVSISISYTQRRTYRFIWFLLKRFGFQCISRLVHHLTLVFVVRYDKRVGRDGWLETSWLHRQTSSNLPPTISQRFIPRHRWYNDGPPVGPLLCGGCPIDGNSGASSCDPEKILHIKKEEEEELRVKRLRRFFQKIRQLSSYIQERQFPTSTLSGSILIDGCPFFGTSLDSALSLSLEDAEWEEGWTNLQEGWSVDVPPKQLLGGDAKAKVHRQPPSQKRRSGQPPQLLVGHRWSGPVVYATLFCTRPFLQHTQDMRKKLRGAVGELLAFCMFKMQLLLRTRLVWACQMTSRPENWLRKSRKAYNPSVMIGATSVPPGRCTHFVISSLSMSPSVENHLLAVVSMPPSLETPSQCLVSSSVPLFISPGSSPCQINAHKNIHSSSLHELPTSHIVASFFGSRVYSSPGLGVINLLKSRYNQYWFSPGLMYPLLFANLSCLRLSQAMLEQYPNCRMIAVVDHSSLMVHIHLEIARRP
ncbi:hypothetical protein VP01_1525g3 [Puccinia sorghi]|uniref:Uncharacterized protein n=1 Tax=Puccinia sorghi TaxID=27349 RepID=A0A0L6VJ99_9BASI|nr:hypothetical protein VP01_1525g3 [Puccinia sorghi]